MILDWHRFNCPAGAYCENDDGMELFGVMTVGNGWEFKGDEQDPPPHLRASTGIH